MKNAHEVIIQLRREMNRHVLQFSPFFAPFTMKSSQKEDSKSLLANVKSQFGNPGENCHSYL